jgi:F-type H+-transporting ATPase subunit 6
MSLIPKIQRSVSVVFRRNIGISAVLAQKGTASDPIQKLFVQKIKEYDQKSKSLGPGKLVDSNPAVEAERQAELNRVAKIYGGGQGIDMTKFPTFDFKDPVLDPINQSS